MLLEKSFIKVGFELFFLLAIYLVVFFKFSLEIFKCCIEIMNPSYANTISLKLFSIGIKFQISQDHLPII